MTEQEYIDLTDLQNTHLIEIVSGGASGADALGERYAKERGYPCAIFSADWGQFGRRAGPLRNKLMSDYADYLICFWDGKSKGAKNMIETAKKDGLKIRIVKYIAHGKRD